MKKFVALIFALFISANLCINAQETALKIYDNGILVYQKLVSDISKVTFQDYVTITGQAERTGGTQVDWVQLWENGPKWAKYNIDASGNKESEYGAYISLESPSYNDGATHYWGDNWRTPTKEEFQTLYENCTSQWVTNYNESGKNGILITGKGVFSDNSIFLPAAGYQHLVDLDRGPTVTKVGENGTVAYWTANINRGARTCISLIITSAEQWKFEDHNIDVRGNENWYEYMPVRPILKE